MGMAAVSLGLPGERLTPNQARALGRHCTFWLTQAQRTDRVDRPAVEEMLAALLYKRGCLPPPVKWCDSPFEAARLGRDLMYDSRLTRGVRPPKFLRVGPAGRDPRKPIFANETQKETAISARRAGLLALRPISSLKAVLTRSLLAVGILNRTGRHRGQRGNGLNIEIIADAVNGLGGYCDATWLPYAQFLQSELGVEIGPKQRNFDLTVQLAQAVGWWWVGVRGSGGPEIIACERAQSVNWGSLGARGYRGDVATFHDGRSASVWDGVYVPSFVVHDPEKIKLWMIDEISNAELARVCLERYGYGRYLKARQARLIHKEGEGLSLRKLWSIPNWLSGAEKTSVHARALFVEVINQTPEPDGHHKTYFLPVHPELRPLYCDHIDERIAYGPPQALTCHNAVASTWGLLGEDYHPDLET